MNKFMKEKEQKRELHFFKQNLSNKHNALF